MGYTYSSSDTRDSWPFDHGKTSIGGILIAIVMLIAIFAGVYFFMFAGNSGKIFKKELISNYGTLVRKVEVYDSWSNKVIWEYIGEVYLSGGKGNYTIMYKAANGDMLKNDFVGEHVVVTMKEVSKRPTRKWTVDDEDGNVQDD